MLAQKLFVDLRQDVLAEEFDGIEVRRVIEIGDEEDSSALLKRDVRGDSRLVIANGVRQ